MGAASATGQSPDEIRRPLLAAAVQRRPIMPLYDGTRRLLCPHAPSYDRPGEWSVISAGAKARADRSRMAGKESGAVYR
jgi:hypothetical protein